MRENYSLKIWPEKFKTALKKCVFSFLLGCRFVTVNKSVCVCVCVL